MAEAKRTPVTKYWGTPDPRDADAYPKVASSTPMTQWAWEFLRRRSDYRIAWEKDVQPSVNDRGGFDETAIERHHEEILTTAIREQHGHRWQGPWKAHQELAIPRPWIQEQRAYRSLHPSIALQDRFRVSGSSQLCNFTLDPRLEQPPLFDGTIIREVRIHADLVRRPKILLEFDLQLPLHLQLENARKMLAWRAEPYAPSAVKLRTDKFPLYLRLLDFNDAGYADKEIGEHLFPNHSGEKLRDNIRKTFCAARRWQDDYLIIALHPPDAS